MELKNKRQCYLKNKITVTDTREGGRYEEFSSEAVPARATIYGLSGRKEGLIYGEKLPYIRKMLFDAPVVMQRVRGKERYYFTDCNGKAQYISEGDGICVNAGADENPDFRIVSIRECGHLQMILEKI